MITKINNVIARLIRMCHCERSEAIFKTRGQTALILILLTAAALIFLAITMNWGRIAQVKSLLTISADESASTLASDAASYGEQEKQAYLGNTNYSWRIGGATLGWILLIAAVILSYFCPPVSVFLYVLAVAAFTMIEIDIALQYAVVGPGMQALWNNQQKNQPIWQQFYEGGISTALQGVVTDQVNITDYFDWNANGVFGSTNSFPNDIVGRFGVFYSDRLKMLNQTDISQVVFFYNQLGELMNGETCAQNAIDVCLNPNNPNFQLNSQCPADCAITVSNPYITKNSCAETSSDPVCQLKIPGSAPYSLQLNDECADSNPSSPTYNPYCDPCCQPTSVLNPLYCSPSNSPGGSTSSTSSTTCTGTTSSGAACNCNPLISQYISMRPSNCPTDTSANGAPAQCLTNNPYNTKPGSNDSPYTLLYDPAYQEYANNLSFLDQFGRDQQMGPFTTSLTPQGLFPNGIYPFFWLMKDYSPEVDNIVSTNLQSSQSHWCTAAMAPYTAPTGYADLVQLSLPYACSGQDCCVSYLANSVINGIPTLSTIGGTTGVVIDAVGTAFAANPAANPALDPSFGDSASTLWQQGDNQMCLSTWPYNGATQSIPDGTCEWTGNSSAPATSSPGPTMDSLDDTMHTLSDFVNFANTFLGQNVGTLSSSFDTWYPQVAQWIAPDCYSPISSGGSLSASLSSVLPPSPACNTPCDDDSQCVYSGSSLFEISPIGKCSDGTSCNSANGRLLSIYDPAGYPNVAGVPSNTTPVDKLNDWNTAITNWLNNNTYTSSSTGAVPWCVPPRTTGSANEDNAITSNGTLTWGSLPSVINCLNYNATTPISNYQACLNALPLNSCPSQLPAACAASTLGRSLAGPAPTFNGSCNITIAGSYAKWASDSLTLATDEAPKFALRSAFLTDIQTRAQAMQNMFTKGDQALQAFFKPCGSSPTCADGGPAAQLIYARTQPTPTATLPNSVIYGWVDKALPNGQPGYAHIVKVTAYAPGRGGNYSITGLGPTGNQFIWSQLPWIKMTEHAFTNDYELRSRDGYVYVSVKRWDEDHSNSLLFPNGRPLWQFVFHNPTTNGSSSAQIGGGSIGPCAGLNSGIGFGLEPQTVAGLTTPQLTTPPLSPISPTDLTALGQAFMLNDNGNGQVDPNACLGGTGTCTPNPAYASCLEQANLLLANAPESHACAQYIGSSPSSDPQSVINGASQHGDADYSLKFVDCNSISNFPGVSAVEDLKS